MMSQELEKNIQKIISSMQPGKLAYESKRAKREGMTLFEWIKDKEYKKLSIDAKDPPDKQLNYLLNLVQNEQYNAAQKLSLNLTKNFPNHPFGWKVLAEVAQKKNRIRDVIKFNRKVIELDPNDASAHCNLGNSYIDTRRLEEAEKSYRNAISVDTNCAEAHYNLGHKISQDGDLGEAILCYINAIVSNSKFFEAYISLGNVLRQNGEFEEAHSVHSKAVLLQPDSALAHYNLGVTLGELGKRREAESSYEKALLLQPNLAEAHNNRGLLLEEFGDLQTAKSCFQKAVKINVNFAEAYCNLGNILTHIGDIKGSKSNLNKAITLDRNYAEAYSKLAIAYYADGEISLALEKLEMAYAIDPRLRECRLLLGIIKSRQTHGINQSMDNGFPKLKNNPLILSRPVEEELLTSLYETNTRKLTDTGPDDARYGNGICSIDFGLLSTEKLIFKKLLKDLTDIMEEAVNSQVFIWDSFFNILSEGGGTTPHHHLNNVDKIKVLDIGSQKFSLVYYLSVGDQNCTEPGILKLRDPEENVMPCDGMITIIPAGRKHSAVYNGRKDRVMIGVNFYSL